MNNPITASFDKLSYRAAGYAQSFLDQVLFRK